MKPFSNELEQYLNANMQWRGVFEELANKCKAFYFIYLFLLYNHI